MKVVSFTFENNTVYFDSGCLLGATWKGDNYRLERNVYWDARGVTPRFYRESWDEWRA